MFGAAVKTERPTWPTQWRLRGKTRSIAEPARTLTLDRLVAIVQNLQSGTNWGNAKKQLEKMFL